MKRYTGTVMEHPEGGWVAWEDVVDLEEALTAMECDRDMWRQLANKYREALERIKHPHHYGDYEQLYEVMQGLASEALEEK